MVGRWLWLSFLGFAAFIGVVADVPAVLETLAKMFGHNRAVEVETFRDCETCPRMVVISSGAFVMGSPSHEKGRYGSEGPPHRVRIDYSIAMSVHEITRQQFGAFVRETNHTMRSSCWVWSATQRAWAQRNDVDWLDPGYT